MFLCSVIAVLFGAVAYQCVIFDEIDNFLQSIFCRLHVRIAFEQADFDFCHNLFFLITAAKFVLKSGYRSKCIFHIWERMLMILTIITFLYTAVC